MIVRIITYKKGAPSDTFSQTASRPTQFFLHSGGGAYILRQQSTGQSSR